MEPHERVKKMQLIADRGLEKMGRQESSRILQGVGDVITLVDKSKDFIGQALKNCESASLAWAGVCLLVLPVSLSALDGLRTRH